MVASIPNGTLRVQFNRAGQISARAETETETEDFAQFRPGLGAEAPLSKFGTMAAEGAAVEQPVIGGRNLSGAKATGFKVGGQAAGR